MVGPGRSQAIFAGDSLKLEVHGKYLEDKNQHANPASFMAGGGKEKLLADLNELAVTSQRAGGMNPIALMNLADILAKDLEKKNVPEAYLIYALYDQDSNRYEVGKKVLSRNAANQHEILEEEMYIAKDGYMETFVVNETSEDVWFDNMMVMSVSSAIVQETHYDPWGLELSGIGFQYGGNKENKYLYNGKELIVDEGIEYYDYGARMYDPVIGRWNVLDPMAGQMSRHSPYNYAFDNPLRFIDPDGMAPFDITLLGANNSSITVKTDLNLTLDASGLGVDFGGNYELDGKNVLQAVVDIGGIFDPTPTLDLFGASMSAESGDYWGAGASLFGAAFPYLGDAAKAPKIAKGLDVIAEALEKARSADNAKMLLKQGRSGKQARLRELANDPKLGSSDKGWINQEINQIDRGKRKNIRNPPGKDLAHERGREAAKGYSYEHSNLQNRKDHRTQHKYDNNGRANKERK